MKRKYILYIKDGRVVDFHRKDIPRPITVPYDVTEQRELCPFVNYVGKKLIDLK